MQVNQTPVRVVGIYPNAATRLLRGLLVLELPTPRPPVPRPRLLSQVAVIQVAAAPRSLC